jgi:multiple sugar transport system substrate-binding protein
MTAQRPHKSGARAHRIAAIACLFLGGQILAACGDGSGASSTPTLNLYIYPDNSGAIQDAVDNCNAASKGEYEIKYQKLPEAADGQRQQMVRRLAAGDSSMDILGLDVTWAPEFAEAGWIREWTGDAEAQVEQGTLAGPLATATYNGKLWAAPFNSNTQLLWYRADLVPTPPTTWDQMIQMATDLAKQGKPHYIEIQGAQYEGCW